MALQSAEVGFLLLLIITKSVRSIRVGSDKDESKTRTRPRPRLVSFSLTQDPEEAFGIYCELSHCFGLVMVVSIINYSYLTGN